MPKRPKATFGGTVIWFHLQPFTEHRCRPDRSYLYHLFPGSAFIFNHLRSIDVGRTGATFTTYFPDRLLSAGPALPLPSKNIGERVMRV
jgi:hypothetical protein